jgi:hypothetical protein
MWIRDFIVLSDFIFLFLLLCIHTGNVRRTHLFYFDYFLFAFRRIIFLCLVISEVDCPFLLIRVYPLRSPFLVAPG